MNMWSYRAREWSRAAGRWIEEHKRQAAMGALLALCALVYLAFFLESPFKSRPMVILKRDRPDWGTVVFSLDRDYPLRSIEVMALTPEGRPAETVWEVRKGAGAEDLSTFAYGQPLRGMEPRVDPAPLKEGDTYRLVVRAAGARGEVDFEFHGGEGEMPARRRRGG